MTDQELCKLLAEKVMGWTIKKQTDGPSVWINERGNWEAYAYSWNPLQDKGQALDVKEKLKISDRYEKQNGQWETTCWFSEHKEGAHIEFTRRVTAEHPDLKRAIALCAARCVGVEIGETT